MRDLLLVLIGSAVVNNVVLSRQVGLCPLLQGAGSLNRLLRLGLVITAVMTVSVAASWLLKAWILDPWRLGPVRVIIFALAILLISRFAAWAVVRFGLIPAPLSAVEDSMLSAQCVVLAVVLFGAGQYPPGWSSLAFGAGGGLGWTIVAAVFEPIRCRLDQAPIASSLRGLPIYLVAFGLLALVGMGLAGGAGID